MYSCLSYPAFKSHLFCGEFYCHLWAVWLYHIFTTLSHQRQIFGKDILNTKYVCCFSLQHFCEMFLVLEESS
jgi:hypothetical protein